MAPTCTCGARRARRIAGPPRHSNAAVPRSGRARLRTGALDDLVAPEVVRVAGGGREVAPAALVGPGEVLTALPGPVGLLAAPSRVDQVLVGALLGAQQLEPLEARGLLHRSAPAAEPFLEALLLVLGHGDRVDL